MKRFYLLASVAAFIGGSVAIAQNVSNYMEQGGARWVVGGSLDVASGGDLDIESGGAIKIAGTAISATATEINLAADISAAFEDTTATNALTTAECGKTITLNSATEFVTTLPAPTAGCSFTFIVKAAPASASYTVVTASSANILIGGINELEVDTGDDGPYDADGDTITFVDGVAVVGDYVTMISDGTSWYLHGQANADGGITVTKAS